MANQNGTFKQFEFIDQSGNLRIASTTILRYGEFRLSY